jgi:hypothetical protein
VFRIAEDSEREGISNSKRGKKNLHSLSKPNLCSSVKYGLKRKMTEIN